MDLSKPVTPRVAAAELGVTSPQLAQMRREGLIPYTVVGPKGHARYIVADVQAAMLGLAKTERLARLRLQVAKAKANLIKAEEALGAALHLSGEGFELDSCFAEEAEEAEEEEGGRLFSSDDEPDDEDLAP